MVTMSTYYINDNFSTLNIKKSLNLKISFKREINLQLQLFKNKRIIKRNWYLNVP